MKTITKDQCINKDAVNKDEAARLRRLIGHRQEWLRDPANKMRTTYGAILIDTRELETELQMLETNLIHS